MDAPYAKASNKKSSKEANSSTIVIEGSDTPPKKKHKKEHKHKHKRHSGEKPEKTKKHKKHKKHKHKHTDAEEHRSPVNSSKSERFTPELSPKSDQKVANGQVPKEKEKEVIEVVEEVKTTVDEVVELVGLSDTHSLEVSLLVIFRRLK